MNMKTATIERFAIFGTSHYGQRVAYRGKTIGGRNPASMQCNGHETIVCMIEHARHAGFTHVRFVGDWTRYTVRKTMRIPAGRYVPVKGATA